MRHELELPGRDWGRQGRDGRTGDEPLGRGRRSHSVRSGGQIGTICREVARHTTGARFRGSRCARRKDAPLPANRRGLLMGRRNPVRFGSFDRCRLEKSWRKSSGFRLGSRFSDAFVPTAGADAADSCRHPTTGGLTTHDSLMRSGNMRCCRNTTRSLFAMLHKVDIVHGRTRSWGGNVGGDRGQAARNCCVSGSGGGRDDSFSLGLRLLERARAGLFRRFGTRFVKTSDRRPTPCPS